jgi:hypothetical protein
LRRLDAEGEALAARLFLRLVRDVATQLYGIAIVEDGDPVRGIRRPRRLVAGQAAKAGAGEDQR